MKYDDLTLAVSPLTNRVLAGKVNKDGTQWVDKVDVTAQFLSCVVTYFEPGTENTISSDGTPLYKITVELIKREKKKDNDERE